MFSEKSIGNLSRIYHGGTEKWRLFEFARVRQRIGRIQAKTCLWSVRNEIDYDNR